MKSDTKTICTSHHSSLKTLKQIKEWVSWAPFLFFFPGAAGNDTASDGPWHLVIAQKGEKRADKWGAWQRRDYVEFRGHISLMCKPSEIPFYCRLGESESLPFNAVEQRSSLGFKICKEVHANIEHCLHYLSSWKVFYQHPARFTFLTFKYSN